jgi:hypothetical protein
MPRMPRSRVRTDGPPRGRPLLVHACVALAALALAVAALAFYAQRVLFDSHRFAGRVELALSEPAVARDAAGTLTAEIVRAKPDLIAVEPLLRSLSEQVVRSAPFRSLAGHAAYQAHAAVFGRAHAGAVLIVGNAALLVAQTLQTVDPAAARQIPPRLRTPVVSLDRDSSARAFVDLARVADRVHALGAIALLLALAFSVSAVLLTPRPRRARTIARLGWAAAVRASGLLDLVWTGPVRPVPTLGEMVDRDQRVLVFGEEETGGVSWYHQQFTYVRDTPYDLPDAAAVLGPPGCALNRGAKASPFLLINQFVAGPPRLTPALTVNRRDAILAHARACARTLGGLPGLIAVDFWQEGDVVGAARELNGLG